MVSWVNCGFCSFVICNNGYTIERYIHGWTESYNDIQPWNYSDIAPAFGAKPDQYKTYQIKVRNQLKGLLDNREFSCAPYLQVS